MPDLKVLPWWQPQLMGNEWPVVQRVLESQYINEGDVTTEFENQIAKLIGAKHAIATTSGTTAIFLGLAALGIGHGDEVLVPDVTFIATANAVTLAGATPVLVDVAAESLNLCLVSAEKALTSQTKGIVPVHVSGRGADMRAIMQFAQAHRLCVVEDAAEALLSQHHGRYLGTFGHAGCFSFSPNKTITTGQGGMIVTNDDELAIRLRQLKDQGRPVRGTGGDDLHPVIGFNFKLTNLQAAVGLAQLAHLPSRIERLKSIHSVYQHGLAEVPQVRLPGFAIATGEVPQWTDAVCQSRDDLANFLRLRGFSCRKFWHPVHTQKPYLLSDSQFPVSTAMSRSALWLPSAFQLSDEDIGRVCSAVRDFYMSVA